MHCSIGNHDWLANQPDNFRTFVGNANDSINTPSKIYYDEWVNGYHYIYLGGEREGLHAWLSDDQLRWFDNLMKKDQKEHPNQPVFVFLHQSMYNTVAGSLPGQNWNGVDDEAAFKKILKKYSNFLLFNGHSHWVLNSESNMYGGSANIPAAFNTASVGYLWTSYGTVASGQFAEGSNGYYVDVYKDKVVLKGRDFLEGKWLPSALYVIQPEGMNATGALHINDKSCWGTTSMPIGSQKAPFTLVCFGNVSALKTKNKRSSAETIAHKVVCAPSHRNASTGALGYSL